MAKRGDFSPDFKTRVALEALRGDRSVQEIASRHGVRPRQVSAWKRQALESMDRVFSRDGAQANRDRKAEVQALRAKVDELTMERDFLSDGLKRWAGKCEEQ